MRRLVVLLAVLASACSALISTTGLSGEQGSELLDAARPDDAGASEGGLVDARALDWRHRKAISIDRSRITGSSDLEGFPVMISTPASPQLRAVTNGGGVEHASGYDLVFVDSDGQSFLPHELERYDGNSGALIAWVRLPRLSVSKSTVLYVLYGNAGIVAPTQRPRDVWDDAYAGVWHLDETTGTRQDSARTGNHLLEAPASVSGSTEAVIGSSAQIRAANQERLSLADSNQTGLDVTGPMTISFWVRTDALLDGYRNVIAKWESGADGPSPNDSFYVAKDVSGAGHRLKFLMEDDATGSTTIFGNTVLPLATWHHVAAVYDGSSMQVYVNGVADGTAVPRATGARNGNAPFDVGNKTANAAYGHDGQLDEVRIARVPRSAAWLRAEFENQSAPGTFVSVGAEETF